jgi:two-component system chemotaxis response regulator CheY
MRIIVVDSEPLMVALLLRMLGRLGVRKFATANDGSQALGLLRARPYDLIIADVKTVPMGGLELLKFVRSDASSLRHTPFIVTADEAAGADIAAARAVGIDGFLLKPFSVARLRAGIEPLVNGNTSSGYSCAGWETQIRAIQGWRSGRLAPRLVEIAAITVGCILIVLMAVAVVHHGWAALPTNCLFSAVMDPLPGARSPDGQRSWTESQPGRLLFVYEPDDGFSEAIHAASRPLRGKNVERILKSRAAAIEGKRPGVKTIGNALPAFSQRAECREASAERQA